MPGWRVCFLRKILKFSCSEIASGMVFTSDFYNISVDSTARSLHNNTAITMYN